MKTIKTSELSGAALDWAAAKCEGANVTLDTSLKHFPILVFNDDEIDVDDFYAGYAPSTDWAQGGPIIERVCIATYASGACSAEPKNPDYWVAEILEADEMLTQYGPTPLIAAMRCFVASKLGDEIEVPDELIKENTP